MAPILPRRAGRHNVPPGLTGAETPLAGRIAAAADVFDALTSDRPERGAWTERDALEFVWRGRATKFDPRVVDALLAVGV
jgi:cyclic di-GMP phosphodiesterase